MLHERQLCLSIAAQACYMLKPAKCSGRSDPTLATLWCVRSAAVCPHMNNSEAGWIQVQHTFLGMLLPLMCLSRLRHGLVLHFSTTMRHPEAVVVSPCPISVCGYARNCQHLWEASAPSAAVNRPQQHLLGAWDGMICCTLHVCITWEEWCGVDVPLHCTARYQLLALCWGPIISYHAGGNAPVSV